MGTVFQRTERRPVPRAAKITEEGGKRVARWKARGRTVKAAVAVAPDGSDTVAVKSGVWVARFRDGAGRLVERSTGCRDESTARQRLAAWEREAEQVRAGVLDPAALDAARHAAGPLGPLLPAYEQSLVARDVAPKYRENLLRDLRRLAAEAPVKTLRDLRLSAAEPWFARAVAGGMKARTRNRYRGALVAFARWCVSTERLRAHDLDKLPKADPKADPVRPRRALTEEEFARLLAAARARPLAFRRALRKGKEAPELPAEVVKELDDRGRERVLIYRTLILTGLRLNELRTLAVRNLDLAPGAEVIRLDRRNEKSRAGSALPVRADLADELRGWVAEKNLAPADRLFAVPPRLVRILARDLRDAGIPRRDDRGLVLDVHALRVTFGSHLSAGGVAPRTAQAAMRHSDIRLTMGVYTDPALLAVRDALDKLPAFTPAAAQPPLNRPRNPHLPPGSGCHELAPAGKAGGLNGSGGEAAGLCGTTGIVNGSGPLTTPVVGGPSRVELSKEVAAVGFEPTTSRL